MLPPLIISRAEQTLVFVVDAPAQIEVNHARGAALIIERSDIPGPPGQGADLSVIEAMIEAGVARERSSPLPLINALLNAGL